MCEYLGYEVVSLQRTRIMNIELGDLKVGEWRNLSKNEISGLKKLLSSSKNTSQAQRNKS